MGTCDLHHDFSQSMVVTNPTERLSSYSDCNRTNCIRRLLFHNESSSKDEAMISTDSSEAKK